MRQFDKDYLKLCKRILTEGAEVENRTGINTITAGTANFHFDQTKEFPILSSKQVYYRKSILEMLWIYQARSNDVRWLLDREVDKVWDDWMIDADGVYRIYEPNEVPLDKNYDDREVEVYDLDGRLLLDKNGIPITIKATEEMKSKRRQIVSGKYYGDDMAYTIGTAYGYIIDKYRRLDKVIDNLKNDPNNRRNVISLYQEADLKGGVLEPCVWSSEWRIIDGKLNGYVHQRSCDVPAGLPFNITQYSVLHHMLAKEAGVEPGTLDWSIMDAHIYVNQIEGIKQQIKRGEISEEYENLSKKELLALKEQFENLNENIYKEVPNKNVVKIIDNILEPATPKLWLNPDKSFYEYNNTYSSSNPEKGYKEDIKILNYKHYGPIRFPVAR